MFIVLVKIELYFFIGFIALYGVVDVHFEAPEFPLTVCLLLFELLQSLLGPYFTKTENITGSLVALVSVPSALCHYDVVLIAPERYCGLRKWPT